MDRYAYLLILLLNMLIPGVCAAQTSSSGTIWRYDGRFGPEHWGEISTDFAACSDGTQQSPIDITDATFTPLIPIQRVWNEVDWEMENIGPTMILRTSDAGETLFDDEPHQLVQIHFHAPAEHLLKGQRFPMEIQFMHVAPSGKIAALSVMVRGGAPHEEMDRLFANLPLGAGDVTRIRKLKLDDFITDIGDVYRYRGSLTMPPCDENVEWSVLSDPLFVSNAALMAFSATFPENARPIQPRNRRYILND